MKTRSTVAAIAITTIAGLGTAAGVASAQADEGATPTGGARREFVCANLAQIQQLQADHATLLGDRLALLGSARAAAEEAGNTKAVGRIDARTAKVTERQAKVAARQEKLATYAAENC